MKVYKHKVNGYNENHHINVHLGIEVSNKVHTHTHTYIWKKVFYIIPKRYIKRKNGALWPIQNIDVETQTTHVQVRCAHDRTQVPALPTSKGH